MIIKIEIDVQPEELRRFLGVPEVFSLPEDVVRNLREKVIAGVENLDANALVETVKESKPWKTLMTLATSLTAETKAEEPAPKAKRRK